jgi:hypothetical protein
MGSIAQGDVIRVTCRFKNTISGDVVNVFHFWVSDGAGDSDANVMDDLEGLIDTMYTGLSGQLQNDLDPYDIRFDVVTLVGGLEHVTRSMGTRSWTLTTNPSASGDGIPQTNAAIVNLRTSIPKVFGRKYIGTLGEGNTADGSITGAVSTALTTWASYLLSSYAGSIMTYVAGVLTSKSEEGLDWFAPFVGAVINSVLGTQRRRRINRGS